MQAFRFLSAFVLLSALCCLATAIDGFVNDEEYGLIMARMPMLYQEWALTKRDVCADAIPGTKTSTCTPGSTLCCTPNNTNVAFPQCQTILGAGYCCVSENSCYIDTPSDCAASNSVPCTNLADGVTSACCPPFTVCPSSYNQSSTVRCNIVQNPASSSTALKKSSTTALSSSTSSSVSTTSSASGTLSPVTQASSSASSIGTGLSTTASSASSLSPGADAGIGIGVALVVLAIAALAFWAYRRGKKKGAAAKAAEAQAALGMQISSGTEYQQYYDPTKYSYVPQNQLGFGQQQSKPELSAGQQHYGPAEMGGNQTQHELP